MAESLQYGRNRAGKTGRRSPAARIDGWNKPGPSGTKRDRTGPDGTEPGRNRDHAGRYRDQAGRYRDQAAQLARFDNREGRFSLFHFTLSTHLPQR